MTVTVKLFAIAAERAETDTLEVTLPEGATVAQLRRALAEKCSKLASILPHTMFAVNTEYATDSTAIPPGAEVACIPPVSGG